MSVLYDRLVMLCDEKGVTGYRAFTDAGVQPSAMTELKMGRKNGMSAKNAQKLATYFGVSVDYLLGNTDERLPQVQPEQDKPEITMLARAGRKMSDAQLDNLLRYAKMMYPEFFDEDGQQNT